MRIDLIDDTQAGLRLIGIRKGLQRQGHGAALLRLAEQAARDFGRSEVVINAHPTSLTFYLANGYAGRLAGRRAGPSGPDPRRKVLRRHGRLKLPPHNRHVNRRRPKCATLSPRPSC